MTLSDTEKRARLAKALECGGGTHTVEDVIELVRQRRAQFWTNGDGCIVTDIERFPRVTAVRFWTISGVLQDCLDLEPEILSWAKDEGCQIAIASGRRGWGRVAYPTGWRYHGHQFWKPLAGRA